LLGYSPEDVVCSDAAMRFIRRGASAASCGAWPSLRGCISSPCAR